MSDINNEVPYFPFSTIAAEISEDTPVGSVVMEAMAVDMDTNSQVFVKHLLHYALSVSIVLEGHCGLHSREFSVI